MAIEGCIPLAALCKPIHAKKVLFLGSELRLGILYDHMVNGVSTSLIEEGSKVGVNFDSFTFPVSFRALVDEFEVLIGKAGRGVVEGEPTGVTRMLQLQLLIAQVLASHVSKDEFDRVSNRLRQREHKKKATTSRLRRDQDLRAASSILASIEFQKYVLAPSSKDTVSDWLMMHVQNAIQRKRDVLLKKGHSLQEVPQLPAQVADLHAADGVPLERKSRAARIIKSGC